MTPFDKSNVQGFLHMPDGKAERGIVLTHGASTNCKSPMLVALAEALCGAGYAVLRFDLAFRRRRSAGSPSPSTYAEDQRSIRDAVTAMRGIVGGTIVFGGHSYGGRQATMLASEDAELGDALLLLSYPLHPPGKPAQLRTAHF